MTTPTLTADDLVSALSESTYMEIFDDDNTGNRSVVDASDQVIDCLADADSEIASWVENLYPGAQISTSTSNLLKSAKKRFARIMAYRRRPELVKTYGAEPSGPLMQEFVELMERIQKSIQRIPAVETPPTPTPPNVGVRISSGDPCHPLPKKKTFINGTGDY